MDVIEETPKINHHDAKAKINQDIMTSSILSITSSLSSPVDSGVQLLDSESELTSVMSNSCTGYDNETSDTDNDIKQLKESFLSNSTDILQTKAVDQGELNAKNISVGNICQNKLEEVAGNLRIDLRADNVEIEIHTAISTETNKRAKMKESGDNNLDVVQLSVTPPLQLIPKDSHLLNILTEKNLSDLTYACERGHIMTKSDIANQNVTTPVDKLATYSTSAPTCDYMLQPNESSSIKPDLSNDVNFRHLTQNLKASDFSPKHDTEADLMNISLNSYELLDYTLQNVEQTIVDDMHVSLSEEVNESLKISLTSTSNISKDAESYSDTKSNLIAGCDLNERCDPKNKCDKNASELNEKNGKLNETDLKLLEEINNVQEVQPPPCDEQIVFRRQRKKKNKSDTPKKRVSFHEDILNSTKIDDIHINHGFITHEPDVCYSFFQRGFIRKPDVVKGRYSWAAEGDAPYYEVHGSNREVKSDIYVHTARFSSTSSSSSASISSSVDEEDVPTDDGYIKREPSTFTKPKSSCLKKKPKKKCIKTDIVQEEGSYKRRSETNLLDTNIFGSLKNILNFSTSVPLAERGVPEGQEDFTVYSSSHDLNFQPNRRSSNPNLRIKAFEVVKEAPIKKLEQAKGNMKLTRSEGFYPNYPPQNLPSNILLCDSNVYEHKGISYSYEYDNFQKSFEQKPKSSTLYQKILKEFNFFKRKAKEQEIIQTELETFEQSIDKDEDVKKPEQKSINNKYTSSTKMDWSDNDTISDYPDNLNSRHLNSPKRKINKPNHYSIQQNFKNDPFDNNKPDCIDSGRKLSSSKTSLINRFLRNVTMKKLLDMKLQKKQKNSRKYLSLYVKNENINLNVNKDIDKLIEDEVTRGRDAKEKADFKHDPNLIKKFKCEVFCNCNEQFLQAFPVKSSYTTNGDSKPLMLILTDSSLYVTSTKANNTFYNNFIMPYIELNTILIGPNAQVIHFSNYDKDMQIIVTTGCANITGDIISKLEMAMRKDVNKPQLPAVKQINMRDMVNLRKAICKQTAVDKDEEYFHYSIVNCQEYNADSNDTPLGPNKEGPLMFKVMENVSRWETAYFILKAGVLYMLSSPTHRVPMRVLPLINGACQGAKRVYNCPRPHTFQLTIGSTILHLAAPDEYVASDWLQALVQAASGTYNQKERIVAPSCSLLMTTDHILTVREAFPCSIYGLNVNHNPIKGAQALSCAMISDLTAFRLPSAEHSWCVLEFSCREVHEISGDWILYFKTNSELENFISSLEMLWDYNNEQGDSFPLSTIPETDPLSKRCTDTYRVLQQAWPHQQVNQQYF